VRWKEERLRDAVNLMNETENKETKKGSKLKKEGKMTRKPKRTRYRKQHKVEQKGRGTGRVVKGRVGRRARERGRITARQLEAVRRTIRHHRTREAQVHLRVFPARPVTKKPREVRMGNGKGGVEYWSVMVRPGTMMYEVGRSDRGRAVKALRAGGKKRPIKTNRSRVRQ
jgi:large subunit ribosomal protein L16